MTSSTSNTLTTASLLSGISRFDMDRERLTKTYAAARDRLWQERNDAGYWEGKLSTSALSTATAVVALGLVDEAKHREVIRRASDWLVTHQNDDGGWGDTDKSYSNISTTLLCWSALTKFGDESCASAKQKARWWIRDYVGSLEAGRIAETVSARYGKDRTFSVPILMLCAICGTLGKKGWRRVLRLPFELAIFPRRWFAAMRLPVVSYALPALIAIGYARREHSWMRSLPSLCWPRVSALLTQIQPATGGFLEAAPLTSFVTMALVASGEREHPVVARSVRFLLETVREDGSWPIDTNLATWSTTLAVKALAAGGGDLIGLGHEPNPIKSEAFAETLSWLLNQQYRERHPFTDAAPGGWAWTDLAGGVPDADDTPGALLALDCLSRPEREREIETAAMSGTEWLLDLQNADGGIPTFCKGWGALPFDRSSPDLTAHTLRAWNRWGSRLNPALGERMEAARARAIQYLIKEQQDDGSWIPLWFGNQDRSVDEANPTYGTALVVRALDEIGESGLADGGVAWLIQNQNDDGGWGAGRNKTPSTIEETALAVATLALRPESYEAACRGAQWLAAATDEGTRFEASPIGFYFARLWYYERSYPIIWTVEALGLVLKEGRFA